MFEIHSILFPVDFSCRCIAAAPYVKAMAEKFGAKLTFLYVVEPIHQPVDLAFTPLAFQLELDERSQHYRTVMRSFLQEKFSSLEVHRRVETGVPANVILDIAHSENVDLIMMPTHGFGGFWRFLVGSVTAKVLHDAECAVWTDAHFNDASPRATSIEHVACAVDLTPENEILLGMAADLAREYTADLTVLHAVPAADSLSMRHLELDLGNYLVDEARQRLRADCANLGIKPRICIGAGDIAKIVSMAAKHHDADLLVIGRSHQNGLGRLRTHSYSIIRESPCPVLSL
jgi:nucleotide-binding universal stress UspA family protein